jgi:NAD(P)-dependent dehydrogenase (short-subunit alcohol dehydrogenase family)
VTQRGAAAAFVRADVTTSASVRDYVEKTLAAYGRIDCFFNNAGIEGVVTPTQDYDEEVFDKVIAVNLKGVFLGLRHVLPVMVRQGGGTIVNTASVAGLFGAPGMPAYVASKHGVLGITKVAAADVAAHGVRVNAVCPGPVETRMMRSLEAQRNPADPAAVQRAYSANIPTGRYATPEEIAGAVLYLSSDLSGDVTGTHIVIDGGRSGTGGVAPRRG